MSSSQLTFIYFRGVAIPPTSRKTDGVFFRTSAHPRRMGMGTAPLPLHGRPKKANWGYGQRCSSAVGWRGWNHDKPCWLVVTGT